MTALFLRGDAKQVRVFVQLVRDLPTSYDAEAGKPIATMRHEVWQFTKQTGAWVKERRTVVFDRVLLPRAELARTTWVWEPSLGNIVMTPASKVVTFELPAQIEPDSAHGWVGRPTD